MRKSRIQRIFCLFALTVIMLAGSMKVSADASGNIQNCTVNNQVLVYLPATGETMKEASAQIGNSAIGQVEIRNLADVEGAYIDTTILFDNSLSISKNNRDKMKQVVKAIINNHSKGELFTLATFDTEIRELSTRSSDYDTMLAQVDAIEFVNQDTYLKNALYTAFSKVDQGSTAFKKFILLSDGSDDNQVGYTYAELSQLLKNRNYQIYSIGSKYERKIEGLEEMFSISRAGNTPYFLLDEVENVDEIAAQIKGGDPWQAALVQIPETAMDGSEKVIKLALTSDNGETNIVTKAEMPFVDIDALKPEPTPTPQVTVQAEPSVGKGETEAEKAKEEKESMSVYLAVGGALGGLLILALLMYLFNKNKKKANEESVESGDDDLTIFQEDGTVQEEEDDSTVLVREEKHDGNMVTRPIVVTLTAENNGSRVMSCRCVQEVTIGRHGECDIAIPDDKAVSGKHCIIYIGSDGNLMVTDNKSSNGTYLNDGKLERETRLENGDTLEIGRTRYIVRITEG